MPDEISIDKEDGIVIIRSSGHVTEPDVVSSSERILDKYTEKGMNRVLIDAREQESFLKPIEAYMTGEAVADNP